jgi:TfoX/Sxy family transcriptional regulator of competence genes
MMKWKKAPPELIARFEGAIPEGAEPRQMFGYPACFVNGNMMSGLHQDNWVVRLGEADRKELLAAGGAVFEPMPGRPMREYIMLPPKVLADPKAITRWMARALAHVQAMPPKAKKPAKQPAQKPAKKPAKKKS